MKKIITCAFITGMLSSSVFASDNGLYVGFGTMSGSGTVDVEVENTFSSTTFEGDLDDSSFTEIKIGKQNGDSKFEIAYTMSDLDGTDATGVDFNSLRQFTDFSVKPQLLFGLGVHSVDNAGATGDDLTAISLNYGIGVTYKISMVELEAGYKGKYFVFEQEEFTNGTTVNTTAHINGLFIGANIRF